MSDALREGDEFEADGQTWEVLYQAAYRGHPTCTNTGCTRISIGPRDEAGCYGWHCAQCHEPCSMMGHDCPVRN